MNSCDLLFNFYPIYESPSPDIYIAELLHRILYYNLHLEYSIRHIHQSFLKVKKIENHFTTNLLAWQLNLSPKSEILI